MSATRSFLIVDDHAVVRHGLRTILAEAYGGAIFGEAENGSEALKHLRQRDWDIVILDINLPDRSGLEVLKDIKYEHPELPVLMLSVHSEDQYAVRVIKAGASGFLTKGSAPEELVQAIRKVLGGGKYITPALAEKLASHIRDGHERLAHEGLSDREFQVLCHIASGKTPSQIADELSLSVKTISTFRSRILAKMQLHTNAELTRYAYENNLIE
jgi:two-component system invasion response regulator UvrY